MNSDSRISNQNIVEKKILNKWHILLIEKQEPVIEENPFSLDANSGGAASASVSETVKNTDSGEYGKRTVASNWTKYEMPPSDSEDDENIIGMAIRVVEFPCRGYKIRKKMPKNQYTRRKLLNFENWVNEEVSKSAKINLSRGFFIKEYQFRSSFLLLTFFDNINF